MVSQAELIPGGITFWFLVLSQYFRDGMGRFKQLRKNLFAFEQVIKIYIYAGSRKKFHNAEIR